MSTFFKNLNFSPRKKNRLHGIVSKPRIPAYTCMLAPTLGHAVKWTQNCTKSVGVIVRPCELLTSYTTVFIAIAFFLKLKNKIFTYNKLFIFIQTKLFFWKTVAQVRSLNQLKHGWTTRITQSRPGLTKAVYKQTLGSAHRAADSRCHRGSLTLSLLNLLNTTTPKLSSSQDSISSGWQC